ncbi:MAG: glycosyl transferase [Verrucomicrobiaceae bacterium]|nr:glycosyl transferase [Verrucomicrobiaceae bacterium]
MKVLQILPELNSGGVERGTLELAGYLVARGHQSVVVSNGGSMVKSLQENGSSHIRMPVHSKSPKALLQVRALRRVLRMERPTILHVRSRLPAWISYLAWKKMPPEQRPVLISTVHGFNSVNSYSRIMTMAERVIAVSDCIKKHVIRHYPSCPPARIHVIPRGVDPDCYHPAHKPDTHWKSKWKEEFPELQGRKLVTLPGRITRLKGHEDFFAVMAQLPAEFHGVVAGGAHSRKRGYMEELMRHLTRTNLRERITFIGQRNDMREVLSESSMVVSLSQSPESFGRTTLEALSLGTPVIGYDHGGVGEILRSCFPEGRVPKGEVNKVVQMIPRIMEQTPSIEAPGNFTLSRMLSSTMSLYLDAI